MANNRGRMLAADSYTPLKKNSAEKRANRRRGKAAWRKDWNV